MLDLRCPPACPCERARGISGPHLVVFERRSHLLFIEESEVFLQTLHVFLEPASTPRSEVYVMD